DSSRLRKDEFWAVADADFELKNGDIFGIVGANGSGKTTLLRLISGILPPDIGQIMVKGSTGSLIAVGAGFHPHMTGRENILVNASILGMSKREILRQFDAIVDFADIGEFLDAPVSTYSSGMYVRLGFAIAIHSAPDIVLVDEILAVGDSKFQRKCLDKIKAMRRQRTTFVIVSHNMQNIDAMCTKALLMHQGKQLMLGSPQEVIPYYELMMQTGGDSIVQSISDDARSDGDPSALRQVFQYGFGTNEIEVKKIRLLDRQGNAKLDFWSTEPLTVEVGIIANKDLVDAYLWISFRYVFDRNKEDEILECLGTRKKLTIKQGEYVLKVTFNETQLATGEYKMLFALFDDTFATPYTPPAYYGYFTSKSPIPTMLKVSNGVPVCWTDARLEVNQVG
ncbi:MAG TPA: polysaccharide ABC transporter ATP-binding protein, partial [Candidatus Bathyarchaeia archaeon]|nr:polysaccharide ABC transporter ATP-binding protein [Candidatus Bathyarchaeia archaeon]